MPVSYQNYLVALMSDIPGATTITLTGDVTGSGTTSIPTTIANDAVTYAKIQNVSAASRLLGRGAAGGAGDVQELTLGTGLTMTGTVLSVDATVVLTTGSYADPAWLTALAATKLTGTVDMARLFTAGDGLFSVVASYQRQAESVDLNTLLQSGVYGLASAVVNGPVGNTYDTLLVLRNASDVNTQLHIPRTAGRFMSYRGSTGGVFTAWQTVMDADNEQTVYGAKRFLSNRDTSSNGAPLQAYSTGGFGAIMAFHRAGQFAVNMGLDSDNVFRIGGWSAAANLLQLTMSGEMTTASVTATNYVITANFYASNGWFRNTAIGYGIYNQASGNHFYNSAQYWDVGYAGTSGIRFRNGYEGTILGSLYAETSGHFGLLSNLGAWAVHIYPNNTGGELTGAWLVTSTLDVSSWARATHIGVNPSGAPSTGQGLSLYGGPQINPSQGLFFQGTATYGTHGAVTADWATYFTMDVTANRGWIFRNMGNSTNVASINNAGVATFNGTITAPNFALSSDEFFKRGMQPITGALAGLDYVDGIRYWHTRHERIEVGVSAQRAMKAWPEAVGVGADGYLEVFYNRITPYLVASVKELRDETRDEITVLKRRVRTLEEQLAAFTQ